MIELFPAGGGGYVVASKLLGEQAGVVSGSALLVDYVLTISISVAAGVNAVFAFLPEAAQPFKLSAQGVVIGGLILLNLRGVRESVVVLTPIFLAFLVTHVVLIGGVLIAHLADVTRVAESVGGELSRDVSALGLAGIGLIFARAYALGGGTYTGIEAISNAPRPMSP
jgi:amino acid transporter